MAAEGIYEFSATGPAAANATAVELEAEPIHELAVAGEFSRRAGAAGHRAVK